MILSLCCTGHSVDIGFDDEDPSQRIMCSEHDAQGSRDLKEAVAA